MNMRQFYRRLRKVTEEKNFEWRFCLGYIIRANFSDSEECCPITALGDPPERSTDMRSVSKRIGLSGYDMVKIQRSVDHRPEFMTPIELRTRKAILKAIGLEEPSNV